MLCVAEGMLVSATLKADEIAERARKLHFAAMVIDTHDDTTQRLLDGDFDLGRRSQRGSIDIPRMKEGGLARFSFRSGYRAKSRGLRRYSTRWIRLTR